MVDRINKLIDKEGISVRRFEKSINASNGLIRKAIANKTDVQSKWILEIADTYPHVNLEWLIKGEGDMYKTDSNSDVEKHMRDLAESENLHIINELKHRIEALTELIKSKEDLIKAQSETINSKNEIIDAKDRIIASLTVK